MTQDTLHGLTWPDRNYPGMARLQDGWMHGGGVSHSAGGRQLIGDTRNARAIRPTPRTKQKALATNQLTGICGLGDDKVIVNVVSNKVVSENIIQPRLIHFKELI
ncbi:BgTH12-07317 [Blumeria graminis f. sp. triticale]|uniref:BgTH12-07317 n=1 Tax=Blumeria graminis f. sp. triticale TaxID=1689686 RepID=A0A9W4GIL8_BLUGR|nr:BgTH12-07317 [Blumeria graminis f. sp. triticale]